MFKILLYVKSQRVYFFKFLLHMKQKQKIACNLTTHVTVRIATNFFVTIDWGLLTPAARQCSAVLGSARQRSAELGPLPLGWSAPEGKGERAFLSQTSETGTLRPGQQTCSHPPQDPHLRSMSAMSHLLPLRFHCLAPPAPEFAALSAVQTQFPSACLINYALLSS